MRGVRDDLPLNALRYSIDAARSFGFRLDDGLVDAVVSEYRGGTDPDEEEAVASAILRTGLVHRAATYLQEPQAAGYYEPQYHLHVLVSAAKGALDGLALWLKFRRKLPIQHGQCDFTKESFRQKLGASFPQSLRGLVQSWLDDIRGYSIWLEHRGTMPIIPLVDPATRQPRGYDLLVDRVTRRSSSDDAADEPWQNPEDLSVMAALWGKRLADFVSAFIYYGMGRNR